MITQGLYASSLYHSEHLKNRTSYTSSLCITETTCRAVQALQSAGQSNIVHTLIETGAKGQALQPAGQRHIDHTLVETGAKGQALQPARQSNIVHAVIESVAKGQALQAARQSHSLKHLVKIL